MLMEENWIDFFKQDRFAAAAGIQTLEAGRGYCRCMMPIGENHMNSVGVVHGGAIFTLADFAFAVASNSHGQLALAVQASISFLKSVSSGILYAEATEVVEPTRLGCYEISVSDESGSLVARFSGFVYRKHEILSFKQ